MPREFPLATVLTARDAASPVLRGLGRVGQQVGDKLRGVGRAWSVGVTAPVGLFGTVVARTVVGFEGSMNRVQALTSATSTEFAALRQTAQDLANTSPFSASQVAEGMGFLAQAGFDTREILDAMPAALQAAAAGQLGLAETADLASNVLSGFGIDASETSRVVDVLAFASASSNTSLQQLGDAFKFVAPVARGAGVSLEEAAGVIGMLSDAGIQGEMAGTSLRGAIVGLLKPSREAVETLTRLGLSQRDILNDEGQLTGFTGILEKLSKAGATTKDVFSIFGQRPGSGVAALLTQMDVQGVDAIANRVAEVQLDSAGKGAEIAATQMRGLGGALQELRSKFENFQIAVGDSGFTAGLTGLVKRLGAFFDWAQKLPKPVLATGTAVAGLAASIGPLALGLGAAAKVGGTFMAGLGMMKTGLMALPTALALGAKGTLAFGGALMQLARVGFVAASFGMSSMIAAGARFATLLTTTVVPAVIKFSIALFANPIGLVIAGIAALIAAGVALYKNWDQVSAFLEKTWETIKRAFADGIAWITGKLKTLSENKVFKVLTAPHRFVAGKVASLFGSDAPAAGPAVDTSRTTAAVAPGAGQDGRAKVEIDVRGGRDDVRVNATAIDDLDLELNQGIALGAVG